MAITTKKKKSAKKQEKAKEQDIFIWHGVNRKGKKIDGEFPDIRQHLLVFSC